MNREIKFRGQKIGTCEWIYGYYVYDTEWAHGFIFNSQKQGIYFELTKTEVSPSTVGQFTNTKDLKENEIYSGDIIDLDFESVHLRGKVIQGDDGEWIIYQDEHNMVGVFHNKSRIIVVGNIYENPELLPEIKQK